MCVEISPRGASSATVVRMASQLLTAGEVADQLRVSTMTVYRLIRRGELPAVRVGRNYRVRLDDLEAFLEQQVVDPADVRLDQIRGIEDLGGA